MAVAFVSSTAQASALVTSTTISLTPEITGDGTMLIVGATSGNLGIVSSVEYGGVPMTEFSTTSYDAGAGFLSAWYTLAPPAGQTLIVLSGNGTVAVSAANFSGVDQANPFTADTVVVNSSASFTYSLSGGAAGELAYDIIGGHRYGSTTGPFSVTEAGQTEGVDDYVLGTSTNVAGISQSYISGAASVTFGWTRTSGYEVANIAVSLRAAGVGRARAIKYFHDINDPGGRIYDDLGRVVSPWDLKPNNWIRVTGLFLPTSTKYASFTKDPELAYIEEVTYSIRGGLRIKTNRGEMTEVLLARAAGGKTL